MERQTLRCRDWRLQLVSPKGCGLSLLYSLTELARHADLRLSAVQAGLRDLSSGTIGFRLFHPAQACSLWLDSSSNRIERGLRGSVLIRARRARWPWCRDLETILRVPVSSSPHEMRCA